MEILNPSRCKDEMVAVDTYIKDILSDLKYSTENNFTGKVIYTFKKAYLRYGTVQKLKKAQELLKKKKFRLKIWDAFRPVSAQFLMWEYYPDDDFVADPTKGFSNHSRGNTVDVTVVDENGNELLMPTSFDDFEAMINYDYNAPENNEATQNAYMLKEIMIESGFCPSTTEWWHFTDSDRYPVEEEFSPI